MKRVYWGKHIISNAFISISSNKDVAKEANGKGIRASGP